jgi:hypothetical protein
MASTEQSSAEADGSSFEFTHILYISPHTWTISYINIHDLTGMIISPYPSEEFKAEAEEVFAAQSNQTPAWIIQQGGIFKKSKIFPGNVTARTDENAIASWARVGRASSRNGFKFPPDSPHSSHDLEMRKVPRIGCHDEIFVQDSVQYCWKYDARVNRKFTLFKMYGTEEIPIAKYKGPRRLGGGRGGTLVVNSKEVDLVVVFLSCTAMLRKAQQRNGG